MQQTRAAVADLRASLVVYCALLSCPVYCLHAVLYIELLFLDAHRNFMRALICSIYNISIPRRPKQQEKSTTI